MCFQLVISSDPLPAQIRKKNKIDVGRFRWPCATSATDVLQGIAGSNSADGMDIHLLSFLCVVKVAGSVTS